MGILGQTRFSHCSSLRLSDPIGAAAGYFPGRASHWRDKVSLIAGCPYTREGRAW